MKKIESMRRAVCALCVVATAIIACTAVRAELPPQYVTWADFGVIVSQASIPQTLGVVDRIERIGAGKYVVYAGVCFVEIAIVRELGRGSRGQILAGPSRISAVKVGERRCN